MTNHERVVEDLVDWLVWLTEAVKTYPIDLVLEKIDELEGEYK